MQKCSNHFGFYIVCARALVFGPPFLWDLLYPDGQFSVLRNQLRQSIQSTVPFQIWGFAFFIIDNNSLEKFELLPKRVRDGTGLLMEANDWIVLQLCHVYK